MSEPSYFDQPLHAQSLRGEALSWLGTPFREYHQAAIEAGRAELSTLLAVVYSQLIANLDIKGPGGGIDCIGLASEIFTRIRATGKWNFPRAPADYQSTQLGDKVLDWLRGKAADPQSKLLAQLFVELEVPTDVTDRRAETPRDFFKPGDLLVLRHGSLFHMPIIYDHDLHFVSALPRWGVIEGTIQDSSYSIHLVAAFRLKPR